MSTIRKATIEDVDRILELINFYGEKELLLRKSPFKVFKTLQNFFVAEENEKVIGCASLIILWRDLGEICSLAVEEGLTSSRPIPFLVKPSSTAREHISPRSLHRIMR